MTNPGDDGGPDGRNLAPNMGLWGIIAVCLAIVVIVAVLYAGQHGMANSR